MSAAAEPDPQPAPRAASASAAWMLHAAWRTHRGNFRRNNEDHVLLVPLAGSSLAEAVTTLVETGAAELTSDTAGCVAIVCDGVGGGAAGEVASALAARTFLRTLRALATGAPEPAPADPAAPSFPAPHHPTEETCHAWLRSAVEAAHREIMVESHRDRALEGMGTTLTAAWFRAGQLHLAQVGDSRLYRLRAGRFEQLSDDQSFVGRLRRTGAISERTARRHPLRNIVDQVVGGSEQGVSPDVRSFSLAAGDEYLLCSDGLSDSLDDLAVARTLVGGARQPVATVTAELLQRVLESAGRDNVTLLQLRVGRAQAPLLSSWLARARLTWHARRLAAAEAAADSDPPFPPATSDQPDPQPAPPSSPR